MSIECDLLVIGGGPAGCSTALASAKKGLKTILIEEDKKIGTPVQCAEGIGNYLFKYMPFKIPKEQLLWEIHGMYFWADDVAIKKEGKTWSGYSIDRIKWDQWLSKRAEKQGVKIYTNTKLESLGFEDEHDVNKAIVTSNGKTTEFKPKYIVGADGPQSTVIKCLNIEKKDNVYGYVKSYEMKNIDLKYPYHDQLYFGNFAPKAYAYIFPLSKTRANIGVGTINEKEGLDELLNEFSKLDIVKKQISNGDRLDEKSGVAPISNLTEKLTYGNVFLVGDAANQNIKPFIEGTIPAIICGNILGNFIHSVDKNEIDPKKYDKIVNKRFKLIKYSQKYSDLMFYKLDPKHEMFNLIILGLVTELIPPNYKKIRKYIEKGYDSLREKIIKNGGFIEK
jgi:digeranylgeranylglycerophospholipid reductase